MKWQSDGGAFGWKRPSENDDAPKFEWLPRIIISLSRGTYGLSSAPGSIPLPPTNKLAESCPTRIMIFYQQAYHCKIMLK
jgi:hypothetical protein